MRLIKLVVAFAILGVVSMLLFACGGQQSPKTSGIPASGVTIHKKEVPITFEYAARVRAFNETQVRARVGGIMLHRYFDEGAEVKQGDALFQIDPDTYEANVAAASAAVAQAQANYNQSVTEANRAEQLVSQRVYSLAQRDQAVANRDSLAAALKQAQAQLRSAELNLQYTKVTAPLSGQTSLDAVSEGSLIGTGSSDGLLTTITQVDPIYVNFSYTDDDARQIRQLMEAMKSRGEAIDDLEVVIKFGDGAQYNQRGTVDFTSATIDTATGTLAVRAVVPNPERRLVPGQFVRVTVVGLTLANAIVVPEDALLQDATGPYVFVASPISQPKPAGEAEQSTANESADNTIYVGARRSVKVVSQLEDKSWLLADAVSTPINQPSRSTNEEGADGQGAQTADQKPAQKPAQKIVGINDGEIVLITGQVTLQNAMLVAPPGQVIPLKLTHLDGKALGQSDNSKE